MVVEAVGGAYRHPCGGAEWGGVEWGCVETETETELMPKPAPQAESVG